jgi:ubiquinone/menaquinone biosynthesis C-methylase UbiE
MATNYDSIAWFYDVLSRLVYGKTIINAQVALLPFIRSNSRVLIVGGGTGWILEKLTQLQPKGLYIDYVESSAKMIELSKKRHVGNNLVSFINLPAENFEGTGLYDVIFTPFFFDNFSHQKIEALFNRLQNLLKDQGIWLYADFVHNKNENRLWQKFLLNAMYLFFHVTCHIETHALIDMEPYFKNAYNPLFEKSFYAGFIKAMAWRRK